MRVFVDTPPSPVVTWEEARAHLRLEADDERQSYVMGLVAAATAHIDGPAGWLGRSLGVQTLEARLDDWGCGAIRLPYPPAISVTTVKYVDSAGVEQLVAGENYEILGPTLVPAFGLDWPVPRAEREAIRIQYQAGYDDAPAPIKVAVGLMVRGMFDGLDPEAAMSGAPAALLAPYRVFA